MSSVKRKRLPVVCCEPAGPSACEPLRAKERGRCVAVFRALGDATRLEVFRAIAGHSEPICVCELTARFDVSQPTISHHLKVLREAGLVTSEKRGVWAYYAADPAGVEAAREALAVAFPEPAESRA